jgi:hypothetical protein
MTPSRGRARIGVLVPFTNTNLEPDLALMAPPGLSLHIARMGGYDEDEIPDETQMQGLGRWPTSTRRWRFCRARNPTWSSMAAPPPR